MFLKVLRFQVKKKEDSTFRDEGVKSFVFTFDREKRQMFA